MYYLKLFPHGTILGLTLMCFYFYECNNNESKTVKSPVKEEKTFDNLAIGYDEWGDINGLFSFDGQDYFNKLYFLARLKNGYVTISYQNKKIKLKSKERNVTSDFVEEIYRNDSIKLVISARPNTRERTRETLVFGAKARYYDAEMQLNVSGKTFVTKAFGAW